MGRLLDEALDAGAFGMSTGLIYPPGVFSATDELVALAKRLPEDRVYATHMRSEGAGLFDSIDEAVEIGRQAGCRVQISHLKAAGRSNWGQVGAALERLDARPAGRRSRHPGRLSVRPVLHNAHRVPAAVVPGGRGRGRIESARRPGHARPRPRRH